MAARESFIHLEHRRRRREKVKSIFLWAALVALSISVGGYFAVGRFRAEQVRQRAANRLAATRVGDARLP